MSDKPKNIFISWSGERSQAAAKVIYDWLPTVVQHARPWLSWEDIKKGAQSLPELTSALSEIQAGIFCLTPDNTRLPWINFEAGAISKGFTKTRVFTYLLDGLEHKHVDFPLAQFQHTRPTKEETYSMVEEINDAVGDPIPKEILKKAFDRAWPELDTALKNLPSAPVPMKKKTDRQLLEEILALLKEQAGRRSDVGSNAQPSQGGISRKVIGMQEMYASPSVNPFEELREQLRQISEKMTYPVPVLSPELIRAWTSLAGGPMPPIDVKQVLESIKPKPPEDESDDGLAPAASKKPKQ